MKTKFINKAKYESTEFERFQKLVNQNSLLLFDNLIESYGLILSQLEVNSFGNEWKVSQVNANTIQINAGKAIVSDGVFPRKIKLADNTQYSFADNGTFKVLIKYAVNNFEEGTITLTNNSADVVGTGTKFLEILGPNRRIIVDNTPYQVLSVADNEHCTLVEDDIYTGETTSGLKYKTGGWFTSYPAGINDNLLYEYDTFEIVVKGTAKASDEYWLAEVTVSNNAITNIVDKRGLNIFEMFVNAPTIFGTPANTFLVGGRYVQLENDLPPVPQNFHIWDIYGTKLGNIDPDTLSLISLQNRISQINQLSVVMKFNWDNIEGQGGINTYTLISPDLSAINLVGYFLNPQEGVKLKITAQNGNALTVQLPGGGDWDGTGKNNNSENPAVIHSDADKWEIIAIPYNQSDINNKYYDYSSRIEESGNLITYANKIAQNCALKLNIGTKYLIRLRLIKGNKVCNYVELEAGSFTKYSQTQNYTKPLLIKHPVISSTGASVTVSTTRNGFQVAITGWTDAEMFEIVYTTNDVENVSFSETSYLRKITNDRIVDIGTTFPAKYKVAVRALISGLEVATPIQKEVVSGSVDYLAGTDKIVELNFNHKTYSGTVEYNIMNPKGGYQLMLTNEGVNTPVGGDSITVLPDVTGEILTDSAGHDFIITKNYFGTVNTIFVRALPNGVLDAEAGAFKIGTSKYARQLLRKLLPNNYEGTFAFLDVDIQEGEDVIIRIYQEGKEAYAKTKIITASDTPVTIELDGLSITSNDGNRYIIVDLWDPSESSPKNNGSLSGMLTVYAKPYNKIAAPSTYLTL